jgi:hypothetical protein
MPKFNVFYTYNGYGRAVVIAKDKKEAEQFFNEGNAQYNDDGDNYEISGVEALER